MPPIDRRRRTRPGPRPGRTVRANLSLLPADLADLDALALQLARPGWAPNRSDAIRELVRAVRNAEADGLLSIEDGRIHANRPGRP